MIIYYKEDSDVVVFIRTVKWSGRIDPYPRNTLEAFSWSWNTIEIRSIIEDDDTYDWMPEELTDTNKSQRWLLVLKEEYTKIYWKGKTSSGSTKQEVIDYLNEELNGDDDSTSIVSLTIPVTILNNTWYVLWPNKIVVKRQNNRRLLWWVRRITNTALLGLAWIIWGTSL